MSGRKMMDDAEGQQEDSGGNRRQNNQTNINSAMQPLA